RSRPLTLMAGISRAPGHCPREGAVPVTGALAPDSLARGILCSCSRLRAPGAGPSKRAVPQVPSRITVIWWRLLTCLAAGLVVVRLPAGVSALVRHGRARLGGCPA